MAFDAEDGACITSNQWKHSVRKLHTPCRCFAKRVSLHFALFKCGVGVCPDLAEVIAVGNQSHLSKNTHTQHIFAKDLLLSPLLPFAEPRG